LAGLTGCPRETVARFIFSARRVAQCSFLIAEEACGAGCIRGFRYTRAVLRARCMAFAIRHAPRARVAVIVVGAGFAFTERRNACSDLRVRAPQADVASAPRATGFVFIPNRFDANPGLVERTVEAHGAAVVVPARGTGRYNWGADVVLAKATCARGIIPAKTPLGNPDHTL
jgi:hypothetical protein